MKNRYIINTFFLNHLPDYHVQQKDIARCLNISEAAVSQAIKHDRFSMQDIECIAEYGNFSHGSFMAIEGVSADYVSQVTDYVSPPKRLYLLLSDLMSIYATMTAVSKATGVSMEKLRMLKERVNDERYGQVTPTAVLKKLPYRDFLTLLSQIDNVDPWRYINDENGVFPIGEDMVNAYIPAKAFKLYKEKMDADLKVIAMAKENLAKEKDDINQQHQEDEEKIKMLNASLKKEQDCSKTNVNTISKLKSDNISQRMLFTDTIECMEYLQGQLDMMEQNDTSNSFSPFIMAMRRKINDLIPKIKPKK